MRLRFFLLAFLASVGITSAQTLSKFIITDQFGYLPDARKIAVIKNPQVGFDAGESFTPGSTYALVNSFTGEKVFTASPTTWKSGATDPSSGDKAWHFDFSSVTQKGSYYVLDVEKNLRSFEFEISPSVYNEVLRQSMRFFFYQRVGFPKEAKYAGIGWADGASHIGPLQDKNCRLFSDKNNPDTELDLSGGWYDAGDYNKYTSWTASYLVEMMKAYLENPVAWGDDYNIPESGNGIPDILDEAKWGLDFLLRMQRPDGGSLCIVSESHASPPSSATGQSVYGPATTSATLNSAAAFAICSKVYRSINMNSYADTLLARAKKGWSWAVANPNILFNNNDAANSSLGVGAGNQEEDTYGRSMSKLRAACFLFEQTNESLYRTYFDNNYQSTHFVISNFAYPFEAVIQETLLYYTRLQGATSSVVNNIRTRYKNTMLTGSENFPAYYSKKDPYGSHMADYVWGSNGTKCLQGSMYYDLLSYAVDSTVKNDAIDAAQAYIHYIHGLNPLNMVYLSNMYKYGGDNCVNEFYHSWFANGSPKWDRVGKSLYGPPPGFLTGGPNPSYNWAACCPDGCGSAENNAICLSESISPPTKQPKQKSYKDFNTSWPLDSWEVTENSCGYQVYYIRLLSKFVNSHLDCNGDIDGSASLDACGICSGGNTGMEAETNPCNCPDRKLETVLNVNKCGGFTSPSGKYLWTSTGTYSDTISGMYGCDSLLIINLKVDENSSSGIVAATCDSYISPSGKYNWKASGIYYDTIPNQSGCDSIITVDLKIAQGSKTTIYPVACGSYTSSNGETVWTNSGIYKDTLTCANGCDSIITVKLTIKNPVVSVTQTEGMLKADATGDSYRWFSCTDQFNLIEDATSRSYTPAVSGEYAVEVTQSGCVDTSACYQVTVAGYDLHSYGDKLMIYPNPTTGKIKIFLPEIAGRMEVELKNSLGQTFHKEVFLDKKEIDVSLNAPRGLYFLVLKNYDQQQFIIKLLIV